MSAHLQEFQDKEFNKFLKLKENGLVIFSAPWCAACKGVISIIEKMTQSYHKIKFIKINVSKCPGLASHMNVMSLPNILIIQKGKVAGQIIGATSQKEIENKLKKIQAPERAM